MSGGKRDYLLRLQTLLVFIILNGMAKMKLAILPFLSCGVIVKNLTCDSRLTACVCVSRPLSTETLAKLEENAFHFGGLELFWFIVNKQRHKKSTFISLILNYSNPKILKKETPKYAD